MHILVTGASGYIGGRLIPRLLSAGHHVTCLVRQPSRLNAGLPEGVEIRQADLLDPASLLQALPDIDVAYYLVHSMADGVRGYLERDQQAAGNFASAARQANLQRIIYLGALGQPDKSLSPHLEARQRVGEILRSSGASVTEFRAAIVIGSGSMSFEMIRYLTERLPILPTPPWIATLCQPIAIRNVLDYLTLCLTEPRSTGLTFEIGGPDVLTYEDIIRDYALARRLRRRLVKMPFLTTPMLAFAARLITPLPHPYLHILIEGLRSEVVVRDESAQHLFKLDLIPYHQAITQALTRDGGGEVERTWSGMRVDFTPGSTHMLCEGMYIEQRRLESPSHSQRVYAAIAAIGGKHGWYYANRLWKLRGWVDRLLGGPGLQHRRQIQDDLQVGDIVGGYVVEAVQPGRLVRLRNLMKAPGPAWLQFEVQESPGGGSLLTQTAFFEPHGLAGLAYWYGLYPVHQLVFRGMARGILRQADRD